MNKKLFAVLGGLAFVAFLGASCGGGGPTAGGPSGGGGGGPLITDMCSQFSPEWMKEVTGKTIAKAETKNDGTYCQYYTEYSEDFYKLPGGETSPGGPWFAMNYENTLLVENQKKAHEGFLDHKIETNPKIGMEHFVAVQEDGLINEIFLVLGESSFLSITRSSGKVLSEEEVINLAAKVAEVLKKGVPKPKQAESQMERAREFFQFLADKKIDEALSMMDANQTTKEGWRTNFKTIQSLRIKGVNPVFEEEWTSSRQVFKFDLDVKVTSEGEGYGWNQGQNARWISLQKNGETWQIHELANNP